MRAMENATAAVPAPVGRASARAKARAVRGNLYALAAVAHRGGGAPGSIRILGRGICGPRM